MPKKGLCLGHSENSKETNVCVAQGARMEDVTGYAARVRSVECEDHFGSLEALNG